MNARDLPQWLQYIERQHPQSVALGLERVDAVRRRMSIRLPQPLIVVGGTNGKGSTCAMLDAMLRAAGYRTGLYSSPHLLRYNERVSIQGELAGDDALCEAFAAVERARGEVPLTYFEFGTLAAAWLFGRAGLDAAVLEVGLGGRLDAVNAFDADCAVLTSVALDHRDYLGDTREAIGREKAGIFRAGRPAVVADPDPPRSVIEEARRLDAELLLFGRDFDFEDQGGQWRYRGRAGTRAGLAAPALRGAVQLRNAAAAIAALDTLKDRLPVGMQDIRRGLAQVTLAGRFQVLPGRPQVILDVAHNPEAAANLCANLAASGLARRTIAVFGMLRDKDIAGVVRAVAPRISRWHAATLDTARGANAAELAQAIASAGAGEPAVTHATVAEAFAAAQGEAGADDKIVVFGSFHTVAQAMTATRPRNHG